MPQRSADRKKEVATAGGRGKAAGEGRRGRKSKKREGRPERLRSSRLKSQLAKISQESSKVHTGRKYVVWQSWNDVTKLHF